MSRKLYKNWAVHNIIAHPIMEICGWFGLFALGVAIHNATLPEESKEWVGP